MNYIKSVRLSVILVSLFPALWGVLALLNNFSSFSSTSEFAIYPIISMQDTHVLESQTWRAIDSMLLAKIALVMITLVETMAGVLAFIGIFKMIKHINSDIELFNRAKSYVVIASSLAVLIWGIGFCIIAGDYFLTWQSASSYAVQIGGLIYCIPCFLTLIVALVHNK